MIKEKTEKSADSDSTITQLAEKIQDLKNGIEANQKFIAETEDEISSRTEDRAADKKENQATIADAYVFSNSKLERTFSNSNVLKKRF